MANQAQRAGARADLYVRQLIEAAEPRYPYFAIRTQPKCERQVRDGLWSFGLEASLVPFFPGYVFSRFHPRNRLRIAQLRGVHSIIGCAGAPTPIDDDEMEAMLRIDEAKLAIGPAPFPAKGAPVVVLNGPLEGIRGVILGGAATESFVVSMAALERSIAVRVEKSNLGPFRPGN